MKVSKTEKRKIIAGLLPSLREDAKERAKRKRFVSGEDMIKAGVEKDSSDRFIVPQKRYEQTETVLVTMNHERRLSSIIDSASSKDAMTTALANYLIKYGKKNSEEEVPAQGWQPSKIL